MIGLEPTRLSTPDPKSGAATNYATSACSLSFSGAKIDIISNPANKTGIKLSIPLDEGLPGTMMQKRCRQATLNPREKQVRRQ